MKQKLAAAGLGIADISLRGRFHSPENESEAQILLKFCASRDGLQLPHAQSTVIRIRSDLGSGYISRDDLHVEAIKSILLVPPQWYQTFRALSDERLAGRDHNIVVFGKERCVPPSLLRGLGHNVIYATDVLEGNLPAHADSRSLLETDIAVVGVACKVAGAEDIDDFWDILSEGRSQHKEVSSDRFSFETVYRDFDPTKKWYANLIDDPDMFDHKFFKKTPREAISIDPQQRQLLQIVYQAVQQSGYFRRKHRDKSVGCYVGVCSVDYEDNIACYNANAFSVTGHLRGFIAGKVSHHFGWTGPGLTIDTACSSSMVAVHQACQAILNDECTAAVAAGTHVMTSPLWFQNLAGASFLSKTGQCKPFDAKADGYCRGEGVAAVVLKRLSKALKDGDHVLGIITGTSVQQNENCTPLVVPNVPSLSNLFENVLRKSRLEPKDVTVVEAHGTGTQVGDSAEYESVRKVFGGLARAEDLTLSSVKGLIGHCECTSGLVALVKVLLMMRKGAIPPQASFDTFNPAIRRSPSDHIRIPVKTSTWNTSFRVALINNYGASGSNASMVVTQAPGVRPSAKIVSPQNNLEHPLMFCGFDEKSLYAYAAALRAYLTRQHSENHKITLTDIASSLSQQINPDLPWRLSFVCRSLTDLEKALIPGTDSLKPTIWSCPEKLPVVLCFGGQISNYVGLDKHIYKSVPILRQFLDHCNASCISQGLGSTFPAIFSREPIQDPTRLQLCLFALQYSCAQCWMACGVEPVAVVGHSFGELTSLCVAGALSLDDTVRMIAARSQVIRDEWGADKGAMVAVDGDIAVVRRVLEESNKACRDSSPAEIACFNGPRSFTIAGSRQSIDAFIATRQSNEEYSAIRAKQLEVTHAFHSHLVGPLRKRLIAACQDLTFQRPKIPLARATEFASGNDIGNTYVADHMRNPVYFDQAVQRLAKQYPKAIWLEAGSNSTVTNMASRALGAPTGNLFQSLNILREGAWANLVDATTKLWKAGLDVFFWPHQRFQMQGNPVLLLPPYQFEKSSHWLHLRKPPQNKTSLKELDSPRVEHSNPGLISLLGYQDSDQRRARFLLNTKHEEYQRLIQGHVVALTAPICPATVQLDLVTTALRMLLLLKTERNLQLCNIECRAPICLDDNLVILLDFEALDSAKLNWKFRISSSPPDKLTASNTHTTGTLSVLPTVDSSVAELFSRYQRLVKHQQCLKILHDPNADEVMQGRVIYKTFSDIVNYQEQYHGLQRLVGSGHMSAGRVIRQYDPNTWFDAHLADTFCQVVGIWLNCMTNQSPDLMYIARTFEMWTRSPTLSDPACRPAAYDVLAYHQDPSGDSLVSDVFVFHSTTGELLEIILGVNFVKVFRASLAKILARSTNSVQFPSTSKTKTNPARNHGAETELQQKARGNVQPASPNGPGKQVSHPKPKTSQDGVLAKIRQIISELAGVEQEMITSNSELADLGVDSLLGMEVVSEIEQAFHCSLPMDQVNEITGVSELVNCVLVVTGSILADGGALDANEKEDSDSAQVSDHSTVEESSTPRSSLAPGTSELEIELTIGKLETAYQKPQLAIPPQDIIDVFRQTKALTDEFIRGENCTNYCETVLPLQTSMCIAFTLEAFERLGVNLRYAQPGEEIKLFKVLPEHVRLVRRLCEMLETRAGLIRARGDSIRRTDTPYPSQPAASVVEELQLNAHLHRHSSDLCSYVGPHQIDIFTGKVDGVKLLFGSVKSRELLSSFYGDWPMNKVCYEQMKHFFVHLVRRLSPSEGLLKILEMGAGTGGTTKWLVPLLASLNIPVEYTFTDLSPSLVATAQKRFQEYDFMKFRTHDIEKAPPEDLVASQHFILASNAVHATHSLIKSASHIKKFLRPAGALMMLEMVEPMYWVDMVFGLFEGWWFTDDGRQHALTPTARWKTDLQSAGFEYVDWTEGGLPESEINKLIVAVTSEKEHDRAPRDGPTPGERSLQGPEYRQSLIDEYVHSMTQGFCVPQRAGRSRPSSDNHVLVTGATGSVGSHIVAALAKMSQVKRIITLNRISHGDARQRQLDALALKGISLNEEELEKLDVRVYNPSKANLGLGDETYQDLAESTTHIFHSAWAMSLKRPLKAFESQLRCMRHLIDLASRASAYNVPGCHVKFVFVSSIAVVGHNPLWKKENRVPESEVPIQAVMPIGYAEAKYICELMLDKTLGRHPEYFQSSVVRLGQVAGSRNSGYWNTQEHLSFIWKTSHTIQALPQLPGTLSWTPVEDVAGTLVDIGFHEHAYPVYNIDNPFRQDWAHVLRMLADALGIPHRRIIPFQSWVDLLRSRASTCAADELPALKLVNFLDQDFIRMSCGSVILDTTRTLEHSPTLRSVRPADEGLVKGYVSFWKNVGFLN